MSNTETKNSPITFKDLLSRKQATADNSLRYEALADRIGIEGENTYITDIFDPKMDEVNERIVTVKSHVLEHSKRLAASSTEYDEDIVRMYPHVYQLRKEQLAKYENMLANGMIPAEKGSAIVQQLQDEINKLDQLPQVIPALKQYLGALEEKKEEFATQPQKPQLEPTKKHVHEQLPELIEKVDPVGTSIVEVTEPIEVNRKREEILLILEERIDDKGMHEYLHNGRTVLRTMQAETFSVILNEPGLRADEILQRLIDKKLPYKMDKNNLGATISQANEKLEPLSLIIHGQLIEFSRRIKKYEIELLSGNGEDETSKGKGPGPDIQKTMLDNEKTDNNHSPVIEQPHKTVVQKDSSARIENRKMIPLSYLGQLSYKDAHILIGVLNANLKQLRFGLEGLDIPMPEEKDLYKLSNRIPEESVEYKGVTREEKWEEQKDVRRIMVRKLRETVINADFRNTLDKLKIEEPVLYQLFEFAECLYCLDAYVDGKKTDGLGFLTKVITTDPSNKLVLDREGMVVGAYVKAYRLTQRVDCIQSEVVTDVVDEEEYYLKARSETRQDSTESNEVKIDRSVGITEHTTDAIPTATVETSKVNVKQPKTIGKDKTTSGELTLDLHDSIKEEIREIIIGIANEHPTLLDEISGVNGNALVQGYKSRLSTRNIEEAIKDGFINPELFEGRIPKYKPWEVAVLLYYTGRRLHRSFNPKKKAHQLMSKLACKVAEEVWEDCQKDLELGRGVIRH